MINEEELLKKAYQAIDSKKEKAADDYYRLNYHIMPPAGLLNDPNGFIQFEGDYHLFYQFNPFATSHGAKFWAHLKSKNLVDWQELPLALAPAQSYETHGCYSGSAVNNNGTMTLIYTGNVKDENDNRETYQCLAVTEDGVNFEKLGPVINNQPDGYTRHFRDPKVWQKDGIWYLVIGTQNINKKGRVLLYRSEALKEWDLMGEVVDSSINNLDDSVYMWECPDMFTLKGKEVLIGSPQGINAKEDLYNNIHQSGYLVGELNYQTGEFKHQEFKELDRGFDFYAAQTTGDKKGRRILIAWMGLPDQKENYLERENGWVHTMTIPRILELNADNKLIQKPVPELKSLRSEKIVHQNIKIDSEEIELANIEGDSLELIVEFKNIDAEQFGLKLRTAADDSQKTTIFYDQKTKKLIFDRSNSGKGENGIRSCLIENKGSLKLHFFVDTSSIELFVNNGQEVFTSRVYPQPENKKIKFFAINGKVNIKEIRQWKLTKKRF
ncbi:MAG: glycoside hydrolase family 32 protein [Bacillota bacterium]